MSSVDDLRGRIAFVRGKIEQDADISAATDAGATSKFWADIFSGRRNWPGLNEISVFRREGFTSGIGDEAPGDYEREKNHSARMHHIFRRMVSPQFIENLPEPIFGAPFFFEHDDVCRSTSFWINSATTKRVMDLLDLYGKRGPLRVLEIGAGWGGCLLQLHHALDIESCLIVDLPQNLYVSAIYLGTVFPERRLNVLDVKGEPVTEISRGTIAACLPGAIGRILSKFDLVINSFSLQEMDLGSVRAYMDWIGTILSNDGIFVSMNSHAKAGVRQPSDYDYAKFHIHHLDVFRKSPPAYFNTIPYEVVVGRRRHDSPAYPTFAQDALGWLMQLGLDRDLSALCENFVTGDLGANDLCRLSNYSRFFRAKDDSERAHILRETLSIDQSSLCPFVSAHFALLQGEEEACRRFLADACSRGLSGFARIRAEVLLAAMVGSANMRRLAPIDELDAAYAYPEVATILATGDLAPVINHINRILRRN